MAHTPLRTPGALAAGACLALLTGCGGASSAQDAAKGSGGDLKVGVLFPGSLSDDGFMESAHRGYQRAAKQHSGKVAFSKVEQVQAADYEQALVRFATTSDLVISLGGQTDAAVRKVAARFPKVKFAEIGGPADAEPTANLALYDPQQAQAAFLSGAAAALLSKKGTVGFVGGAELPAIVNAAKEFERGAEAADPKVEVLAPQYVGDFNDAAKSKQSALADYGAGADVLGQVLNLGHKGIAQAAAGRGGRLVGGPLAHDCGSDSAYAGYVETDIGAEIEYATDQLVKGAWKAESVHFGLTFDTPHNDLVLCGSGDEVTAAEKKLDAIKAKLASGEITTR
ncbi:MULTISPECIES: BMP family ABC transporter substrate-binding protein [unclassified Streptomyces]|uniref:BMP family ABC transporter substrate-binding protein n=1 Tax=unclassified Streptomyces TaxID=2593676 RepID=UPI000DBA519D|nr:BMP family ABC transporter substrate-binding protein [Streptomyces sp. PsTaAH-137]MYT69008.1 BMP family ABC transporter substrate-binding protein [Streptomyces sp. SID8367]RAJ82516.1 basic membrane protein A [Streptomyces sp. PsTaAH-137]